MAEGSTVAPALVFALLAAVGGMAAGADNARPEPTVDRAVLERIRDAAMASDWAWQRLAELTDTVGPRLSGSPQLEQAIDLVAQDLRDVGAHVQLQPVRVPHWVRGEESAELVSFGGQRAGLAQRLRLTTLGGTPATPSGGLVAPVLVVHDFDELKRRASDATGAIVVFESVFDERLAERGYAEEAYSQVSKYRSYGPGIAAQLGAAAVLVRSIGSAARRDPHAGSTYWKDDQPRIPAAALAAEDADLLERLAARGPMRMRLVLSPQTLPDADSANVLADWPGSEAPDQIVLVSGHLDSWDLGTGAQDDGAGTIAAAAVLQVLHQLDLHPRRTVRFVAWTNEENGVRGARAYVKLEDLGRHVAVIESDAGAGRPLGVVAAVPREALEPLRAVTDSLAPIGASVLHRADEAPGTDSGLLQRAGVPGFAPLLDVQHYFDIHHTAADTLDKIDPRDLRAQVATLAVLAYYLAQAPQALPRTTAHD